MEVDKLVVIKKQTQLEELLVRHSTTSQAKFYLEAGGHSYEDYDAAHRAYVGSLQRTTAVLPNKLRTQIVDKRDLATFQFGERDLVIVVGDDGLLVNVSKYVGKQPVILVNPDEERFDGVLATCNDIKFPKVLKKTLEGDVEMQGLTMAEVQLDDGQSIRALNDLFIGRKTHPSSRYILEWNGMRERQSTSGMVISTGTGSTGWLTSFKTFIERMTGGRYSYPYDVPFDRTADYLIFTVREPFPSKITDTNIVHGMITRNNPLKIESNIPEEGVIFGDGVEKDYLEFNSGRTAIVQPSSDKVYLVIARDINN